MNSNWFSPHFIAHFMRATSVTVAESDDGTVWTIVDGSDFYLLTFTDEKYKQDVELLQEIHQRNGILAPVQRCYFLVFVIFSKKKGKAVHNLKESTNKKRNE